jgi:alcohol/geraniol dehydrogenase (NADP+)
MGTVQAWAAASAGGPLKAFSYEAQPLAPEDVEIEVEHCGVCHSDLSMLDNEWGITRYPFVPGHEAIGRVVALGDVAREKGLQAGQRVGVGWNVRSCLHCAPCIRGEHHLCERVEATIVGRHGAFAQRVRAHWLWAVPIPEELDASATGPLLCGGITVFAPLLQLGIRPTDRVGVVGIGGLGHIALKFLHAWGCEVTALTSSPGKAEEARGFGAHHVLDSRDAKAMAREGASLDLILVTANATLDWNAMLALLAPNGRLHFLGAVLEPMPLQVMSLMSGQKGVSSSPTGSRAAMDVMLRFAAQHGVAPQVEHFAMSRVNEAMEHLREGRARYRIVLDADF